MKKQIEEQPIIEEVDPADVALEHQDRDEIEKAVVENQKEKLTALETEIAQLKQNQQVILDFIAKVQSQLNQQSEQPVADQQPQQPMDANTANTLEMLKTFLQPKEDNPSGTLNTLALDILRSNVETNRAMTQWFIKKALKE